MRSRPSLPGPLFLLALAVHLGLYFFGARLFPGTPFTFGNPGVTVSLAMLAVVVPSVGLAWVLARRPEPSAPVPQTPA